jgi:adenylate cyclase
LDKAQDLSPREEEIAVAFLDIRDFTRISNNIGNIWKMNKTLELLFQHTCKCITQNNGFIDKFIGDSVMWFHQEGSIESSSRKCIDTAIDILKGMDVLNEKIWEEIYMEVPIKVGIGIACGKVAVGIFGAPDYRIQYSLIGPTVNLASRLCSKADKDEIIIGDTIIGYCPYETQKKGLWDIKGFEYKIEIRKVVIP